MTDLHDHDPDLGDHDRPIRVITMDRSWRSRWAETRTNGPWRAVFIAFWTKIRDEFANPTDRQVANFWGDPRESNIFNKISLTILAADFFQFLCERARSIDSVAQVSTIIDEWLTDVSRSYFNRDWRLAGVKKDSTGIRNQWAKLWTEYRRDPQRLPRIENYRVPSGLT